MLEDIAFQYPADLEKAMKHRLANRVFKGITKNTSNHEKCVCCDRRIGEKDVSIPYFYSPKRELVFLGPGVPLLFVFIQNGVAILLVLTLVFSVYATISNLMGDSCILSSKCIEDIFNKLSLSNKIDNNQSVVIQTFLIALYLFLYLVLAQLLIYRIRKSNEICDEIINSPSDYSIIMKNLPQNVEEKDIENLIEEHRKLLNSHQRKMTKNLLIRKIIISYCLQDYLKKKQQQEQAFLKLKKENKDALFTLMPIEKPTKTASIAIVIFDMQISKQMFFEEDFTDGTCRSMLTTWCSKKSSFQIKNKDILISRAPEPDDILWKNADIPKARRFRNVAISFLLGIAILFSGGVIQYYLQYFQLKISDPVVSSYFSYVTSILVTIYNTIIVQFLIFATKLQGNETKTDLDRSLMIKICLYSFFNAGIFYSLANILAQTINRFDIEAGFSFEVTLFLAMNAVPPNLTSLLLKKLEIPACIFRYLLGKGYLQKSQKQANKLFQLTKVDFPVQYAYVIKTIWLTCFYASFTPIVVPISIVGLVLFYFTEAELFRTSYNVPNMLSLTITKAAIRLLDFSGVILSAGQFLIILYIKFTFKSEWKPIEQAALALCLAFSILLIVIPSSNINKFIFKFENKYDNPMQYNRAAKEFSTTYEGTNPLSDVSQKKRKSDINLLKFLYKSEGLELLQIDANETSNPFTGLLNLPANENRIKSLEIQQLRQSLNN